MEQPNSTQTLTLTLTLTPTLILTRILIHCRPRSPWVGHIPCRFQAGRVNVRVGQGRGGREEIGVRGILVVTVRGPFVETGLGF